MKRPVRIYKAQLGAQQVLQQQQQQSQQQQPEVDPNALYNQAAEMLNQGATPEDVVATFVQSKVPLEVANQIVSAVVAYFNEEQALDEAEKKGDTDTEQDLIAERQAEEEEAQQQLAYRKQMEAIYNQEQDPGYDEEDQVMQQNLMRFGGNQVPKRTFLKKAMSLIKKQEGGDEEVDAQEPNVADSTDTGDRAERLTNFLGSVQGAANQAKMKEDAEAMYAQYQQSYGQPMDMYGQDEMTDMGDPMARRGRAMRPERQQRQIMRGVDRMLRHMPMGMTMPGQGFMPPNVNVFNLPMMAGAGMPDMSRLQQMPDMGYFSGGPRLANIDVRKTGLFGRPKEYTITWANDGYYNPATRQEIVRQEQHNEENQVKDKITDDKAVTTNTSTDKNEEVKVEEKKDPQVTTGSKTTAQTPGRTAGAGTASQTPDTYVDNRVEASEPWAAPLQAIQAEKQNIISQNFGAAPVQARSNYLSSNTGGVDMSAVGTITYYDPNKPGFMYVTDGNDWFYDAPGGDMTLAPVTDPKRVAYLNQNLQGANMYTLPSKKGYYYRLRPDGAYAKYSGDPKNYTPSSKPVQVIKPGDTNYDYLNKNKQYSYSYVGKQQFGGMTDQASGLTKFVNGGYDLSIPEVGGKLTNDPYFREGGLYKFQGTGDSQVDPNNTANTNTNTTPAPDVTNQEMYDFLKTQGYNVGEYRAGIDYSQLVGDQESGTSSDQGSYYPEGWGPYAYGQGYYPPALPYNNPYIGNYNMYGTQGAAMYPPLFGNRFGPPGRVFERAGSWLQQSGLPFDPATGMPITGMLGQQPMSKFEVTKSGLFGPKEFAMYFGDYGDNTDETMDETVDGTEGTEGDYSQPNTDNRGRLTYYDKEKEFNENKDARQQRRLNRQVNRDTEKYNRRVHPSASRSVNNKIENAVTDAGFGNSNMNIPGMYETMMNQSGSGSLGPGKLALGQGKRAYGGEQLPQAQMMGEFNAGVSSIPAGYYRDPITGLVKNTNGITYSPYAGYSYDTARIQNADWANEQMAYGGVPQAQFGKELWQRYFKQNKDDYSNDPGEENPADFEEGDFYDDSWDDINHQQVNNVINAGNSTEDNIDGNKKSSAWAVKGKIKNMFNVDFERGVNEFNRYFGAGLQPFEEADDRLSAPNMNTLTGSEKNYGNKWFQNKGRDPETNSGLSFINQTGAKLQKKKGGSTYKEGAITYMSAKQVEDFIKQGGKLEFIK